MCDAVIINFQLFIRKFCSETREELKNNFLNLLFMFSYTLDFIFLTIFHISLQIARCVLQLLFFLYIFGKHWKQMTISLFQRITTNTSSVIIDQILRFPAIHALTMNVKDWLTCFDGTGKSDELL